MIQHYYSKAHRRRVALAKAFTNIYSMLFDGVDEFININAVLTNSLAGTTIGTWSTWIKTPDVTNIGAIIAFGMQTQIRYIAFRISGSGKLQCFCFNDGVTRFNVITDNVVFINGIWYHVGIVQDGTEPVLYVNGIAVAQSVTGSTKGYWVDNFGGLLNRGSIGIERHSNFPVGTNYFEGNIDEPFFSSEDYSASEMLSLYNNGKAKRLKAQRGGVSWFRTGDKTSTVASFPDQIGTNDAIGVNFEESDRELDVS